MGIAWATALIRISLPALDNSRSFQPWIICQTLYFKHVKTCDLALPIYTGSPKYRSFIVSVVMFSVSITPIRCPCLVFGLNMTANLPALII
jgi:hypothetical protein